MSQTTVSEIQLNRLPSRNPHLLWKLFLAMVLTGCGAVALELPWGTLSTGDFLPWALPTAAGLGACMLFMLSLGIQRRWLKWILCGVPGWLVFLLCNPQKIWQGILLWVNCLFSRYNELHQGGLALFQVEPDAEMIQAVSVTAAFFLGYEICWIVRQRKAWIAVLTGMALLLFQLAFSWLSPWLCTFYLLALLGWYLTDGGERMTRRGIGLWGLLALFFLVVTAFLPDGEVTAITNLRQAMAQEIHVLRYGEDVLPQGELSQAAKLKAGEEELLTVKTGQEKTLYLRGFVGAGYQDGVWEPLPDSAYAGTYAGLLNWLGSLDFDPLTQVAQYEALCDEETAPEENRLWIQNVGASRYYLYLPVSTMEIGMSSAKEEKDTRFGATGIRGNDVYAVTEKSSPKPAELTVREQWVANPQTDAQKQYVEAEAMYREFVYETYTEVAPAWKPLLEELFWKDYESKSDSIYSALNRVRNVLGTQTGYAAVPEFAENQSGEEQLRAFLSGNRSGNEVFYATAAAQALRCVGIPTRYVEGYYLSAEEIAGKPDGNVTLTGKNAHAWIEVYFDGIGWLPVDVTPGYYYDAVTLQQLIALPDTVRKTAALEGGNDSVNDISQGGDSVLKLPEPEIVVRSMALVLLGLAAILVIAVVLGFLGLELARFIMVKRAEHHFRKAQPGEQIRMLKERLYTLLALRGIQATMGVETDKVDEGLQQKLPTVHAGEYTRVVFLLEKVIYGEIPLQAYELRTVNTLLEKLSAVEHPGVEPLYWRIHYSCFRERKKKAWL